MRGISKVFFEKEDKNFDRFRNWIVENGQKIGKWENIKVTVAFFGPKNETKKLFSFRSNENHMDDFFLYQNQIIQTDNNFSEILTKFDEFSNRLR
jgi:hypothetical protein